MQRKSNFQRQSLFYSNLNSRIESDIRNTRVRNEKTAAKVEEYCTKYRRLEIEVNEISGKVKDLNDDE